MTPREQEIEERLKAATPGPWVSAMLGGGKGGPNIYSIRKELGEGKIKQIARTEQCPGESAGWNGSLIAHAPADLAYLLNALKDERERREQIKSITEFLGLPISVWQEVRNHLLSYCVDNDIRHGLRYLEERAEKAEAALALLKLERAEVGECCTRFENSWRANQEEVTRITLLHCC